MKRILFIAAILLIAYSATGQNTIMHQGKIGMQYTVSGTQKNLLMDFTADSTRFVIGNTWYTFDKSIALRPNKIIKTGTDTLSTKAYVRSKMSTGTNSSKLASFYTDAATSGTGQTDLYSYTVPGNTLSNNGDCLEFYVSIFTANTTPSGSVYFSFGGYTGSATMHYGNLAHDIQVQLIRISSTKIRISSRVISSVTLTTYTEPSTTFDFTSSIVFKIGASANSGTTTARFGYIKKL